jgi:hypothetical protein
MNIHARLFATHNGLVRTRELLEAGTDTEMIRWTRNYRKIVHVRHGWWALPSTDERLMRAWRSGGRLACVSALAFHGQIVDLGEPLHIEVPEHSSRPRSPGVVVHWASDQRNGDRRAVSVEVAERQASRCRAANGTL